MSLVIRGKDFREWSADQLAVTARRARTALGLQEALLIVREVYAEDGCSMCGIVTNNADPYCHQCLQELAETAADDARDLHLTSDTPPDSNETLGVRNDD